MASKKPLYRKDVLVTGADGFIGSHLVKRLLEEGAVVTALLSKKSNPWRIRDLLSKIKVLRSDINDSEHLKKTLAKEKPEIIYHLAASLDRGLSFEAAEINFKTNFLGTINILRALEDIKYQRFINMGTAAEYGRNRAPFKEDQCLNPLSSYAVSKAAADLFCRMYFQTQNRPVVILRPTVVYGPVQGLNMFIPQLIMAVLQKKDFQMSEGRQTRDFIYVADLIEALIKAAFKKKAIGEVFNIGSGKEHQLYQVAGKILDEAGGKIKISFGAISYPPNEVFRDFVDITKAKKILGWRPKVGIEEGLRQTINWYSRHGKFLRS